MPSLSVIVPTLNEGESIGALLDQLARQRDIELELVIADGGSADDTVEIAQAKGARVKVSERGRGRQMNAGADIASHEHLLFLHADSILTSDTQLADALKRLEEEYEYAYHLAGHFPLHFQTDDVSLKASLRYFELKTAMNRPGTFNGDQGLLISRVLFEKFGRFDESLPFLEDQAFGEVFSENGVFITLPGMLETSARRFEEEGFAERVTLNTLIMGMFHLRSDYFFGEAANVYREHGAGGMINLAPFFTLAYRSLFSDGVFTGIKNCYRIGRYGTRNLWQVFLYLGDEDGLATYDRYVSKVTSNPLGYLVGMFVIGGWFIARWIRLQR